MPANAAVTDPAWTSPPNDLHHHGHQFWPPPLPASHPAPALHDDDFQYIPVIRMAPAAADVLSRLHTLPMRPAAAAFSVCPPSNRACDLNRVIWRMARDGYLDAAEHARHFPGSHIVMLRFPTELRRFLEAVTESEIDQVLVDFLILLRFQLTEDNEQLGLAKLQNEVSPSLWARSSQAQTETIEGEPIQQRRRRVLEELVSISYMTPWQVDIDAFTIPDHDLAPLSAAPSSLNSTDLATSDANTPVLNLAREWNRYQFLLGPTQCHPNKLLNAVSALVQRDQQQNVLNVCKTMMCMANVPDCLFHILPKDVLQAVILPNIVFGGTDKSSTPPQLQVPRQQYEEPHLGHVSSTAAKT